MDGGWGNDVKRIRIMNIVDDGKGAIVRSLP